MRLASIDVGSNTVRLLVAEVIDGRIVKEILNLREITRLGTGLAKGGRLEPSARERTVSVLKGYALRIKEAAVRGVSAVATEAIRKAGDAPEFLAEVKRETGIELEVISGREEARRTLLGVKAGVEGLGLAGRKLLLDIGGGSTELVLTEDFVRHRAQSLPVGAVSLYERFVVGDPPEGRELSAMREHCLEIFGKLGRLSPRGGAPLLIGTAGTITTLAAVDLALEEYDPARVTGLRMGRETVARLLSRFVGLPKESRRLIAGLEAGREDIIISGTVILMTVMDMVGADFLVVCDYGLREGNLLDYFEKKGF